MKNHSPSFISLRTLLMKKRCGVQKTSGVDLLISAPSSWPFLKWTQLLLVLFFQSSIKRTKKALWIKVATTWIFLQHSPVQGYVVEARLRVIQSSLALATNEEGALVKVGKVAILQWAWLMWAQQCAAALMPSPRRLSPQRQAGRGSELTWGSTWQNA